MGVNTGKMGLKIVQNPLRYRDIPHQQLRGVSFQLGAVFPLNVRGSE